MEYKRIENKIVFRLEKGDRLMESTQKIATVEITEAIIAEITPMLSIPVICTNRPERINEAAITKK